MKKYLLFGRCIMPLNRNINIASLVLFRICFGLLVLIDMGRYLSYGWVHDQFVANQFHFHYLGLEWINPMSWVGMTWFFCILGMLGFFIALGYFYRISCLLLSLGMLYILLIDKVNYSNNLYLYVIFSFLLFFVPTHKAFSLDEKNNPIISGDTVKSYYLAIMRFQFLIIFFYLGFNRVNPEWLSGRQLYIMLDGWHITQPKFFLYTDWQNSLSLFAIALALLQILLPLLVMIPFTRKATIIAAFLFLLVSSYFNGIETADILLFVGLSLFLPSDWPHWRRRLWPEIEDLKIPLAVIKKNFPKRLVSTTLVVSFLVLQIFLPLRAHISNDNPHWTKHFLRFSWHNQIEHRKGNTTFYFKSRESGRLTQLFPEQYLNKKQRQNLQYWPDLILDFSHHMKKALEDEGHHDIEIFTDSRFAFNKRKPQYLVSPTLDLAKVKRSVITKEDWLIPLTEKF